MTPSPATMILTYKYRLNPERRQHRALERILEQQRQLYNAALQERIACFEKTGRGLTEIDQSRSLTIIRADDPAFAGTQRRIQRETLRRLDRSYKSFFKRAKAGAGGASGFPKFKGAEYFDGFGFDAFLQIKFDGRRLRFAGMPGGIRVHLDRPLPAVVMQNTGELAPSIKNIWFKRYGTITARRCHGLPMARVITLAKRWYCGFQVETAPRASRDELGNGAIGVDWGTSVLACLSSGEIVTNPRHGQVMAKDLARASRAVARRKRGSKRRMKARQHKQSIERRIANRRRNTMDKLSSRLVTHYGVVAVEKIAAKKLMNAERAGETLPQFVKTRRNREALDAAPYMLRQMTAYKARREGCEVIEIDPAEKLADGTRAQPTQRCSMCGKLHFKELTEEHVCTTSGPFQNLRLPRKLNAARVILSLALDGYGVSSLADGSRGGPVPGGAEQSANANTGSRRLGNTEAERSAPGRRGHVPLLTHARGAQDPRLRSSKRR